LKYAYNELKRLILSLFTVESSLDGQDVVERLRKEGKSDITVRAVRMALMRYCRQGLLHREKHAGRYMYSLSDKGAGRLRWLESTEMQLKAD